VTELPCDRIHIRDLRARCIVGVHPAERRGKQEVVVNIALHADLSRPGATDRIEDTVDYEAVKNQVAAMVEGSSCLLIERLAERVAEVCLSHGGVRAVRVEVDKPAALGDARGVGVEIFRKRGR